MAAFLLPWRIPRCRHGGRLCFKIDLPLLCGALPDGRAVDGILVVTVDGGLMAAGDPSTPARGLDDDGRAQLPPWLGLGRASPLAPQPPAAPSAGRKALGVEMCWLFIGTDRAGVEALPCTQSRRFDLLVYTRAARKLLELRGISARSR